MPNDEKPSRTATIQISQHSLHPIKLIHELTIPADGVVVGADANERPETARLFVQYDPGPEPPLDPEKHPPKTRTLKLVLLGQNRRYEVPQGHTLELVGRFNLYNGSQTYFVYELTKKEAK